MSERQKRILSVAVLILGTLILLQPTAMADPIAMWLTNSPAGANMGGVYTSPYQFEVYDMSGQSGFSFPLLACDDFTTDISFHDEWLAHESTLAQVTDTPPPQKFPGGTVTDPDPAYTSLAGTVYTAEELYFAAGVLADELLELPQADTTEQGYYSYAIWQIFDPKAYKGLNEAYTNLDYAGNNWAISTVMESALALALANKGDPSKLNFTLDIYTACSDRDNTAVMITSPSQLPTCGAVGNGSGGSQEFLGIPNPQPDAVPEASAVAFLPFDLLALFGGIFLVRKRFLAN